ncbi:MAG: 2-oxoacid:acceptor oxidoreductase family protein [Oscillospiraceae bacterium]
MEKQIICAGFGGQGVLTAGKLLVIAAYDNGLHLTWSPSYGNEMRGGTANCNVVISDKKIASPFAKHPVIVLAMNQPSVDKYLDAIPAGGHIFVNSSIVDNDYEYGRDDISIVKVPATELANGLGQPNSANIVMLGSVIRETALFTRDEFVNAMCGYFEKAGKGKYNAKNVALFEAGYNCKD